MSIRDAQQLIKTGSVLAVLPCISISLLPGWSSQCAGLGFQPQHWLWGLLHCLFPGSQLVLPPSALDAWSCPERLQQLGVVAPPGESWGYKSDISPPLRLWPSGKPPPSAFLGSAFTVGEPQGGSKPRSRSVLAQPMDPMQSVSLTPFFLCGRLPCRVLLKNLGPPMGQVGYVVLPLPKLGRPFRCCLLLLESPVLCIKHRHMWQSLEDTRVNMGT